MKTSSLWVAGNLLLPREVASFCNLGAQIEWFLPKFSQCEILIHPSWVSASWFHYSCLFPSRDHDFMCPLWTGYDQAVSPLQALSKNLHLSASGDSWDAHEHRELSTLGLSCAHLEVHIVDANASVGSFTWTQPRRAASKAWWVPRCGVQAPELICHTGWPLCRLIWSGYCAASWLCLRWRLCWPFLAGAIQKYLPQAENKRKR